MPGDVRILLLADSHLGFDLPARPRVERRRRGHDFLANYAAALRPALDGEVDLVVHGGDVFDRSKPLPSLAWQAFEPLCRVADRGVPVFIVPGNHERARLPHLRFAAHPGIHVFDRARTCHTTVRGTTIALAGFPYEHDVRARFPDVLEDTGWRDVPADLRLLCLHQCVEGATVGPADYTFTTATDVVRHGDVPPDFAAVLSGHIHRHQVLTTDLARRPLATPVLYPGSIERTAFAEMGEPKGFMIVSLSAGATGTGAAAGAIVHDLRWSFRELPTRPMIRRDLSVDALSADALASEVDVLITGAPADAVISIRLTGAPTDAHWRVVSSSRLRAIAPRTMNVEVTSAARFARPTTSSRASGLPSSRASGLSSSRPSADEAPRGVSGP